MPRSCPAATRRAAARSIAPYTFRMPIPTLDLDKLTRDEKLQLIDAIWDSLENDPDAFPLTESQRRELDRRLDELDRGEAVLIPWEQALKELQSRLK